MPSNGLAGGAPGVRPVICPVSRDLNKAVMLGWASRPREVECHEDVPQLPPPSPFLTPPPNLPSTGSASLPSARMVRQVIRVPYSEDRPRLTKAAPSLAGTLPCPIPRSAMHRVPSLLFDMDLDLEHSHLARVATLDETDLASTRAAILAALEPTSDAEYMVLLHVRFARDDALRRGRALTLASLAEVLHRLGYGVRIRTANGGGRCGACLRNLRHSFLAVSLAGPGTPCDLIVDPAFREQFQIAHMMERYRRVMAMVPEEVVLPPARLEKVSGGSVCVCVCGGVGGWGLCKCRSGWTMASLGDLDSSLSAQDGVNSYVFPWQIPRDMIRSLATNPPPLYPPQLVEVLCGEMQRAFSEKDLSLPPWRALGAMLSKWHPGQGKSKDVAVQPRSRGGGGSAASDAQRRLIQSLQPQADAQDAAAAIDTPDAGAVPPSTRADGCPECGSRACATHACPPLFLGPRGNVAAEEEEHLLDDLEAGGEAEALLGSSPGAIATPSSASDSEGDSPLVRARTARPTPSLHVSWGLGLGLASSCSGSALGDGSQASRSALQAQ